MTDIFGRLKEVSTWRGIIGFLGVTGYVLSPEDVELIIPAAIALVSIVEVYFREKKAASVVESDEVIILNNNTTDQNVSAQNVNFVETPSQSTPELDRIMRENEGA